MDKDTVAQEAKNDATPVDLELRDRNGRAYPNDPPILQIVGEYSPQYRRQEAELGKLAQADFRNGAEWSEEKYATLRIAAGVVGWKNISDKGQPVPFTPAGMLEWFLVAPWHAKRAERSIRTHADFFVAGSTG